MQSRIGIQAKQVMARYQRAGREVALISFEKRTNQYIMILV
jgi:hypothetical protein